MLRNSDISYSNILSKSLIGRGSLFKYNDFIFTGDLNSEKIKNSLYGNQYGKASVR